jgi:hypothetical protein
VLWPVVDWDKQGFAIRPLFNQEGDEYSVLFPLSAWNPVNGDGWLLNTYWDKNKSGFFPLYHHSGQKLWIFPFYKKNQDWWLFPLLGKLDDNRLATLAWWNTNDAYADYGLFPLYWHFGSEKHPCTTLFPLYWHRKDDYTVVPLISHYFDKSSSDEYQLLWILSQWEWDDKGMQRSHLLPLWYYEREESEGHTFLSPLAFSYRNGDDKQLVTPLWQQFENGPKAASTSIFPLWFKWRDDDASGHSLLPLYWHESNDIGSTTLTPLLGWSSGDKEMFNLLGPLYLQSKSANTKYRSVLWPLYIDKEKGQRSELTLGGPLFHRESRPDWSETDILWPLGNYESQENGDYSWRAFPLAGGDQNGSWALAGLYGSTSATDAKGQQHSAYRLSPFFAYNDEESQSSGWYDFGLIHSHQHEVKESDSICTQTFPDTHRGPYSLSQDVHQQTKENDRVLLGLLWNFENTQALEGSSSLFFSFPWWQSSCDYQFHIPEQLSPAAKLFLALDNSHLTLKESEQHLLLFFGAEQKQTTRLLIKKDAGLDWQERQILRQYVQELGMQKDGAFFVISKNRMAKMWWLDNQSQDSRMKARSEIFAKLGLPANPSLAQLIAALPVEEIGTDQAGSSFPLLWGYERDNDQHRFDLLGFKLGPLDLRGLLFSHQGDEKVQESSILRYLYRRRTEGAETQRDIFPLIVWNTGAKEESRFAFLGNFINIKHDAEGKSSGKLLFVFSWGDETP